MATVDVKVAASADDTSGITECTSWSNSAEHLGIGVYLTNHYQASYRFTGITIPIGATITVAYIKLYGDNTDAGSPLTKVYAEDADSPAAPTSCADLQGRVTTTASVDWDGAIGNAGYVNSPSLVSIIQELVNSYDYSAGVIQILHKDDGSANGAYQSPCAYDIATTGTKQAELVVTFTLDYPRTSSVSLGLATTVSRVADFPRTVSNTLGLSVTASRMADFPRTVSTALGLVAQVSRAIAVNRTASLAMGFAVTASRATAIARTVSTSLGYAVTATRTRAWAITSSVALGMAVTASRTWDLTRTASVSFGRAIVTVITQRFVHHRAQTGTNRDRAQTGTNRDSAQTGTNRDLESW